MRHLLALLFLLSSTVFAADRIPSSTEIDKLGESSNTNCPCVLDLNRNKTDSVNDLGVGDRNECRIGDRNRPCEVEREVKSE